MNPMGIIKGPVTRSDDAWVGHTLLFQRCAQRKSEVAVHKWYESERAGQDIGWHRASIRYTIHQVLARDA